MNIEKERQETYLRRSENSPENTKPGLEGSKARQEMTLVKKDMWSKDGDTIQETYI